MTPIDRSSFTPQPKIALPHKPRSSQKNANGLVLVSGADKSMTSVIDLNTRSVILTVGMNIPSTIDDFGGRLACGHEKWLPDNQRFFLLDRINRTISVYRVTDGVKVWSVNTPSSVHHLVNDRATPSIWYAMCEGGPKALTPPSIMVIEETSNGFAVRHNEFLPVEAHMMSRMGSHHLDLHPNGVHIYAGSNEGETFVFDRSELRKRDTIPTGTGNGHTKFSPDGRLATTINHTDKFVTVIDATRHEVLRTSWLPGRHQQVHKRLRDIRRR